MLFRILETCLSIIAIVVVLKEIVLPLIQDKPLFPLIRRTFFHDEPKTATTATTNNKESGE